MMVNSTSTDESGTSRPSPPARLKTWTGHIRTPARLTPCPKGQVPVTGTTSPLALVNPLPGTEVHPLGQDINCEAETGKTELSHSLGHVTHHCETLHDPYNQQSIQPIKITIVAPARLNLTVAVYWATTQAYIICLEQGPDKAARQTLVTDPAKFLSLFLRIFLSLTQRGPNRQAAATYQHCQPNPAEQR